MKKLLIFGSLLILMTGALQAQNRVIRVQIDGHDGENTHVSMTFPLSMIRSFEPAIVGSMMEHEIHGHGLDLRKMWETMKEAGPMDYVEITENEGNVKVSSTGTHIVVTADGDLQDRVHVSIPFALCDALFAEPDEFNMDHLMDVLEQMVGQDIVNITSDTEETVRVWIE